VVLGAVTSNGMLLEILSAEFQDDIDNATKAMDQDGEALSFV